ncbi:Transcription repressor OFP7 [Camellia lanceoleosa]|uniref:Transcription repressor OFP7 n=1 Tax=Camellia lanceoleosa TaxID=1840588 RepID=A0ACC0HFM2_9ERIC|nr:Transcription repressor OFP7 [Camellia lanceoleosa]
MAASPYALEHGVRLCTTSESRYKWNEGHTLDYNPCVADYNSLHLQRRISATNSSLTLLKPMDATPYHHFHLRQFDSELFLLLFLLQQTDTYHHVWAGGGLLALRGDEQEEIVTLSVFTKSPRRGKKLPSFKRRESEDGTSGGEESMDPYEDFKASMMEMILMKHLFEDERLAVVGCFLSLN